MSAATSSSWQTTTGQYTITYTITQNANTVSTDMGLLEYGIECSLSHAQEGQVSFASIGCISPTYETVSLIAQILKNYQVFPAHLHEIVIDLLNSDSLESGKLLCA